MYSVNTFIIIIAISILLLLTIESGYRIGLKQSRSLTEGIKEHIKSVSVSLLGILALLLGFTFSLSLQRYDNRSDAVVDEANCIGTAFLRTEFLDGELKAEAKELLREYIKIRIIDSDTSLVDQERRMENANKTIDLQKRIWRIVVTASSNQPNSPKLALFIESINETFDSLDKREAALNRHVPSLVSSLLLLTLIISGAVLGYAAGTSGHRASIIVYVMNAIIIIIVFIIFDLDRPRRGLIQVNQEPIKNLEKMFDDRDSKVTTKSGE